MSTTMHVLITGYVTHKQLTTHTDNNGKLRKSLLFRLTGGISFFINDNDRDWEIWLKKIGIGYWVEIKCPYSLFAEDKKPYGDHVITYYNMKGVKLLSVRLPEARNTFNELPDIEEGIIGLS